MDGKQKKHWSRPFNCDIMIRRTASHRVHVCMRVGGREVDWTERHGDVGDSKRSMHTSQYLEKQNGGKVEKVERDKKKKVK